MPEVDTTPFAEAAPPPDAAHQSPLVTDLDGTLIHSDLLWESLAALLERKPQRVLRLPLWLARGKAGFKHAVAAEADLDPALLPYRADVLAYLRREHEAGRRIILATASHQKYADAVADHLGLFDGVIGSDEQHNRRSAAKLDAVRDLLGEDQPFDYIGDSDADVPLIEHCREFHLAEPSRTLRTAWTAGNKTGRVFERPHGKLGPILKLVRPHQWAKNLLVFLPLLMAQELGDLGKLLAALLGFIAFSAAASSIYIFNDLVDIDSDRRHASKRRRPLAAGTVAISTAMKLAAGLLLVALVMAVLAGGWTFLGWIALYLALTTAYSFRLKRELLLDVLCLGWLYTHRVIAGGIVAHVDISQWLLAFSVFFFVSLAFAKRYVELLASADKGVVNTRRGYQNEDLALIGNCGPTAGFVAVLVFSLYVDSPMAATQYTHPHTLWLATPVLIYWLLRVWFYAYRGQMNADPIVFAITDKVSYICFALCVACFVLARYVDVGI